ncbi:hypothetical protein FJTKL_05129 [Diaporthe vaccinii]|uniref:Uncharacterized protein n=1 Tax=Diaporthe vaccinii TaxID=105482 RepID=A0ABR4FEL1_9PEZI
MGSNLLGHTSRAQPAHQGGQSLARPPSSNKHPLRFPPHSASLLPLLLPPPATSNLYPTTPNPTYLTWPLSPSHIHQTHHTYEPSPTPNKRLFKVTDSIIIKKPEITNTRTQPGSDCTVSKKNHRLIFTLCR